jgi:hypothetical protein
VESQSSSARFGWKCPECGRQIPRAVDTCRCGAERRRFEALGYDFDLAPVTGSAPAVRGAASEAEPGLAGMLVGYRSDAHTSRAWRIVLTLLFLILVGGAGFAVVTYTHLPLPPTRANVEIVTTLEGHTKDAGTGGNAITTFLTLPGTVAVLEPAMTAQDLLKTMTDADLAKGFCSASLAKQIRYEFPGFYENWPDDKLERVALEKYPEFHDRLCVLPSQLGVAPDDVVKYRLRARTIVEWTMLWSRTALITGVFAMVLLNVYYRLLVARLPAAA